MEHSKAYQIDHSRIMFEQFEDETVLVNTENGYYYSLSASGTEVLRLLQEGCKSGDLPRWLFGDADISQQQTPLIEDFVRQLIGEGILMERSSNNPNRLPEVPPEPACAPPIPFEPPVLERFEEVRDLLMIDPVHQVDQDYGWPKAKQDLS